MTKFTAIVLALMCAILLNILGQCEMSIYPGLRRKPQQQLQQHHHHHQQQQQQEAFEMSPDYLAQLMEDNARRRLHQQFVQQLELIAMQRERQRQRERELRLREKLRQQQLRELAENEVAALEEENVDVDVDVDDDDVGDGDGVSIDYANGNPLRGHSNNNMNNAYDQYDTNADYSLKLPGLGLESGGPRQRPFAVPPSDPRFFEGIENVEGEESGVEIAGADSDADADADTIDPEELDANTLAEYEEYVPAESRPAGVGVSKEGKVIAEPPPPSSPNSHAHTHGSNSNSNNNGNTDTNPNNDAVLAPVDTAKMLDGTQGSTATATFHRIKPQSAAAAAAVAGMSAAAMKPAQGGSGVGGKLLNKLYKEGKTTSGMLGSDSGANVAAAAAHDEHMVLRKHLGIEGEMGMYVVALIAGVSAALTVGLIALGFAWMHNRAKAAADVEYPAYGVTGPNKDISPSGDRKLAQSAQMYHYQHQKQQIIAMENRQAAEGSCGLSDVESDDDNEEGDYTVYECPGLAPTGEMEVKNPLFLDETPVTPAGTAGTLSGNLTQVTHQQPPAAASTRKGGPKPTVAVAVTAVAAANTLASSADEKKHKSKSSKK